MQKRIWELDAARGICILGMVIFHLLYDLSYLFQVIDLSTNPLFHLVSQWGGVLFILISGISATLGSRTVRRGLIVLGCGLLFTAVTIGMYLLRFSGRGIIIWFGVLHCLGICMLLWPLLRRLKTPWLLVIGVALSALGIWFKYGVRVDVQYLFPLGLMHPNFASADYFPLLPNLGYFLIGAGLGRLLYPTRRSLLPKVNTQLFPVRFFCFCGRQSLLIYLLHQPILTALVALLTMLFKEASV